MDKKKMLVLSYGNFPDGDAGSIRLNCMTTLFQNNGFDISIVTMSRLTPNKWINYSGKRYISIRSESNNLVKRLGNNLLYKRKVRKILNEIGKVDAFFFASPPLSCFKYFKDYAIRHNIQLYADRTEWYSPSEFKFARVNPEYRTNIMINERLIDDHWKVISISKMFADYYAGKNIRTVRIPAIMDTHGIEIWEKNKNEKITVVYAGSPAKKDSLNLIVEAFKGLDDNLKEQFQLNVIGVTESQYREAYGDKSDLSTIKFFGRISRDRVLAQLRQADFTTLIRDDSERFTKAGFPSKVAESMSVGIPMIVNLSSDLGLYLQDGENSVIVGNYSVAAYVDALKRISELSEEEIEQMHLSARKTAEMYFDYRNYNEVINKLIHEN